MVQVASRDGLSYKLQKSATYYKSLRSQVDGFGTRLIGLEVEMQGHIVFLHWPYLGVCWT